MLFPIRVEAQRQQVKLVQAEMEFLKNIWKAEEEGLKESIEEQERKVQTTLRHKYMHSNIYL